VISFGGALAARRQLLDDEEFDDVDYDPDEDV
jgi:hypothetical protein